MPISPAPTCGGADLDQAILDMADLRNTELAGIAKLAIHSIHQTCGYSGLQECAPRGLSNGRLANGAVQIASDEQWAAHHRRHATGNKMIRIPRARITDKIFCEAARSRIFSLYASCLVQNSSHVLRCGRRGRPGGVRSDKAQPFRRRISTPGQIRRPGPLPPSRRRIGLEASVARCANRRAAAGCATHSRGNPMPISPKGRSRRIRPSAERSPV